MMMRELYIKVGGVPSVHNTRRRRRQQVTTRRDIGSSCGMAAAHATLAFVAARSRVVIRGRVNKFFKTSGRGRSVLGSFFCCSSPRARRLGSQAALRRAESPLIQIVALSLYTCSSCALRTQASASRAHQLVPACAATCGRHAAHAGRAPRRRGAAVSALAKTHRISR